MLCVRFYQQAISLWIDHALPHGTTAPYHSQLWTWLSIIHRRRSRRDLRTTSCVRAEQVHAFVEFDLKFHPLDGGNYFRYQSCKNLLTDQTITRWSCHGWHENATADSSTLFD